MDLIKAIRELEAERQRLDVVIANLERMMAVEARKKPEPPKKRGRKRMTASERQAVAKRMRDYWATKRAGKADDAGSKAAG